MKIMVGNVPVELEVDDDELILDVVIMARTVRSNSPHGATSGAMGASDGLDRITQVGMLYTALKDVTRDLSGE